MSLGACKALSTVPGTDSEYIFSAISCKLKMHAAILRALYANVTCRKIIKFNFLSGVITFLKVINYM